MTDVTPGQAPVRPQVGFSTSSPPSSPLSTSATIKARRQSMGAAPVGWVYFIRGGAFVKIGWSKNPERRAEQLRTGCPFKTSIMGRLPGTRDDEQALHAAFDWLRTKGEWFRATRELLGGVRWVTKRAGTPADLLEWVSCIRRSSAEIESERALVQSLRGDLLNARAETEAKAAELQSCRDSALAMAYEVASLVEALHQEAGRAIDATDDHEGLAAAVRAAVKAHCDGVLPAIGMRGRDP